MTGRKFGLADLSLKVSGYRSFGAEPQGFERIKPINVIVGRNNSGKSALLDALQGAVPSGSLPSGDHRGRASEIFLSYPLEELELSRVFPSNTSLGDYGKLAKKSIGNRISWKISRDGKRTVVSAEGDPQLRHPSYAQQVLDNKANPLADFKFVRLLADRDVRPEPAPSATTPPPRLQASGQNATQLMYTFIHRSGYSSNRVEKDLLRDLNRVLEPDFHFSKISVRNNEGSDVWEIYLDDAHGQQVALSNSGSGLKTIILVLEMLHLMPTINAAALGQHVIALEEVENNLHPAALRRLLGLLREKAVAEGCLVFLTTHSSVTIDFFRGDENAQILHVMHDGSSAFARSVGSYADNRGILDDLDIRASDLLQANGVIWVEGPSDRILVRKWIEIWSGGLFREGAHYQCLFYGGKVLSHLSADDPDEVGEAIKILVLNRNVAILMDRDRPNATDSVNSTKQRLEKEVADAGGIVWLTAGRELENYYPLRVLAEVRPGVDLGPLDAFSDVPDFLGAKTGKRCDKVELAREVSGRIKKEDMEAQLDLADRLEELCQRIARWNGIKWPPQSGARSSAHGASPLT